MKKLISLVLAVCLLMGINLSANSVVAEVIGQSENIVINEVCSGNSGANGNLTDATDSSGKYCDWIELYNNSQERIDLSGFGISDSKSTPFKAIIPNGVFIEGKGFIVIYCCKTYNYIGSETDKNICVSINISGEGETITLTAPAGVDSTGAVIGTTVDSIDVPELAKDITFGCYSDGKKDMRVQLYPTPGKTNESSRDVLSGPSFSRETGIYSSVQSLKIELATAVADGEIYYTTDSSNPADTGVTGGWDDTSVQSYGYIMEFENVDLDKSEEAVVNAIKNYNNNENMQLFKSVQYNGNCYVSFRALNMAYSDAISFAKSIHDKLIESNSNSKAYLATISDENENKQVYNISGMGFYLGGVYDTEANLYKWSNGENFSFSNFNEEEGEDKTQLFITYGTVVNRIKYSSPVTLGNKTGAENVLASEVSSSLDKGTIFKAVVKSKTGEYSEVVTKSYFIGSTFANSAYNGTTVVSLSTDYNSLNSETYGIEKNPYNKGREWERPAHFDYINDNGNFKLSAECGIRISGAASRGNRKKSYRLYARNDYGDKYFNYDFFKDSEKPNGENVDKYKSLTLRSGANAAETACYMDNYLQKMLKKIGSFETQEGNVCLAFLNGEFWGVYILQENYDSTYFKERYDVDDKNVLIVKNGLEKIIDPITNKVTRYDFGFNVEAGEDENIAYFDELVKWFSENEGKFDDNDIYNKACEKIDIDSFVNYMVANMSIGNCDWSNNNVSMWRTINNETSDKSNIYNDGKWRFNMFDTEFSTYEYNGGNKNDTTYQYYGANYIKGVLYNRTSIAKSGGYSTAGGYYLNYFLTLLCQNKDFADMFAQKYQDVTNIICDIGHTNAQLKPYEEKWNSIISGLQTKRWNNTSPYMRIQWLRLFFENRKNYTALHLSDAAKLNLSGETQKVTVAANNIAGGKVYLNGQQLYLEDYGNNIFNALYLADYNIKLTAESKIGYKFIGWSGTVCSEEPTITVSLERAANIKALFAKDGEAVEAAVFTPSEENIFPDAKEPSSVEYKEPLWNLSNEENKAAVIFNNDGTVKTSFAYGANSQYKTALEAFNAARTSVLSDEFLRMECDIEVTDVSPNSAYWTVSSANNNITLDVNGYSLFCNISRVTAIKVAENTNFSIINTTIKTGCPTENDKTNIMFSGNNNGVIIFSGSSNSNRYALTLKGIKIKSTNSLSSVIQTEGYKQNQTINAYRCLFESGAKYTVLIGSAGGFNSQISGCVDKNIYSFYTDGNNKSAVSIKLYNSILGGFTGKNSPLSYHCLIKNSTVSLVEKADKTGSYFILAGKSVITKCSPVLLAYANSVTAYFNVSADEKIENRSVLSKTSSVYSYLNQNDVELLGDADSNGKVDCLDVLVLRKYFAKYCVFVNKTNADMNKDGKISLVDILLIRKELIKQGN